MDNASADNASADGYKRLALAILLSAIVDCASADEATRRDAEEWLRSDSLARLILDAFGLRQALQSYLALDVSERRTLAEQAKGMRGAGGVMVVRWV